MNDRSEKNKYLAKNTFIFAIGNIGTKLINFLLVPLYSYVLNTNEYGTIDLIFTIMSVVIPVITLNICEAVQRFSMDNNPDYARIFSNSFFVTCGGVLFGLISIPISYIIFGELYVGILIFFYILSYSFYMTVSCFLRGREELIKYSICNIVLTILICCFNILFLVILKLGVEGYISAYALSYFIMSISVFVVGKQWKFLDYHKKDWSYTRTLIKFSIALVPNALLWWVVNSSDRMMVAGMCGLETNGLYAMSYKIPSLLGVASTVFMQAWGFSAVKENNTTNDTSYQRIVFKEFLYVVSLCAIIIIMILRPVVSIALSDAYYESWRYSPFLILGFVFVSLASFAGTIYYVNKDSVRQMYSAIGGAIINVCLNFLLIPLIGANGASIATCISYFAIFLYRIMDTSKEMDLGFINHKNIIILFLVALSVGFVYIDNLYISESLLLLVFVVGVITNYQLIKRLYNVIRKK